MTSITRLLCTWPAVAKQPMVLREHSMLPPPAEPRNTSIQQQPAPSPPNDPSNDSVTGKPENDGGDNNADGSKGYSKKGLSTSKRAAQNRAAQRAFRQRKEGYIQKLEGRVRDHQILNGNFRALQAENYQLRDYIINVQSQLLESQGEVPPPPSNVDGLSPTKAGQPPQSGTPPRLSELGAVGTQQDGPSHLV